MCNSLHLYRLSARKSSLGQELAPTAVRGRYTAVRVKGMQGVSINMAGMLSVSRKCAARAFMPKVSV
jgi:hypothetical protein